MTVKTTKVKSRRSLHFHSLDDVLADAEHLAAGQTQQLGNWTLGQIFTHLAAVYEKSIDGTVYRPGWFVKVVGGALARMVGPLFKRWALRKGVPAGIRPPAFFFKEVAPGDKVTTEEGLIALRRAISRLKSESKRDYEQVFGLFTREEWDQVHVRHAELHLSFSVPVEEVKSSPTEGSLTEPNSARRN